MQLTLSRHLFWDVDPSTLDEDRHKRLIILRVLEYGLLCDWSAILDYYGIPEIAAVAIPARNLDVKTATFISLLADIPRDQFACFATRPSTLTHWTS